MIAYPADFHYFLNFEAIYLEKKLYDYKFYFTS